MRAYLLHRVLLTIGVVIGVAWPDAARAERVDGVRFLTTVNTMLADLAPRSAFAAAAIRDSYRPYVEPLVLDDFAKIEEGLATGGLAPLPPDPLRFNIRVRLDGTSPIGEKDFVHQESYVAARPAAIGCLLDVASRVKSGPIEVTSLVRHLGYQHQLLLTNANAATDVPTHALGVAFDIAIVNTPLPTVLEIRNVLRQMSDAGEIFVIAERQQLVFHVVPQPSRLGWYSDVYTRAITGQRWTLRPPREQLFVTPTVTTAINSVQPLPDWAPAWWAAENVPVDLPISVHADGVHAVIADAGERRVTGRYFAVVEDLLSSAWHSMSMWSAE